MNTTRAMGVIVLAGCLGLAGCGKGTDSSTPAVPAATQANADQTATLTPAASVPATSAPAATQGAASPTAQAPSTTAEPTKEATSKAPSKAQESKPASTSGTTKAASSLVDPATFLATGGLGKAHYFTSGALHCGIRPLLVGCQSSEKVANRPLCKDPRSLAPYVAEDHSEPPADGCTTQGTFMAEPSARELKPGQRLVVGKVSCEAKAVGSVVCETETATITANSKVFDYKAK